MTEFLKQRLAFQNKVGILQRFVESANTEKRETGTLKGLERGRKRKRRKVAKHSTEQTKPVIVPTLEGLCVEAIFSSLFQPQFRAHEPGRKIADAASGHCHNSHTWPFGQEEVQLREFVSTLHVKPLSGPGNLAADEPHERSESCTTPSPTARLLWHLQRALHQAACHASACARCLNIA